MFNDDDTVFAEVDPPHLNEDDKMVWPDAGDDQECPVCDGTGMVFQMDELEGDPDEGETVPCAYCHETGRVPQVTR